ncbi:MAG: Kelch repeat-containing protein, partial [Planctomycetota bacterium]
MKRLNCYGIKFVLVGIVIIGFLSMVSVCSALDYAWTQIDNSPTPRLAPTSAVVNGKIYIIGGWTSEPDAIGISTVDEYDPASNTWTRKADMPTARSSSPSSAVVDGKIYVIGGDNEANW